MAYCSVVQEHLFKSQEIGESEQHVEYVTGHLIFVVPAGGEGGCFTSECDTLSFKASVKGFEALLPGTQPPCAPGLAGQALDKRGCVFFCFWFSFRMEEEGGAKGKIESRSTHCKVVVKAAMLNPGIRSRSCSSMYFSTKEI